MWKKLAGQGFRYAMAALIVFVAGVATAFPFVWYGYSPYRIGNALLLPTVIAKFLLYKYWVFKDIQPRWIREPSMFIVIVLVGWALFIGIQYGFQMYAGLSEAWAFWITAVIMGTVRFLFFRKVFDAPQPPAA